MADVYHSFDYRVGDAKCDVTVYQDGGIVVSHGKDTLFKLDSPQEAVEMRDLLTVAQNVSAKAVTGQPLW